MKTEETSKFCAGDAFAGRDVESIHPTSEIATTGTPAAFTAIPAEQDRSVFDPWVAFLFLVGVFALALVEDRVRG